MVIEMEKELDPRHHTQNMRHQLTEMIDHLRSDIDKVDEPQLKAMFETSAEVLAGLNKAFSDYEKKRVREGSRERRSHIAGYQVGSDFAEETGNWFRPAMG